MKGKAKTICVYLLYFKLYKYNKLKNIYANVNFHAI